MKDCAAIDLQLAAAPLLPDQPADALVPASIPESPSSLVTNRQLPVPTQIQPPDRGGPAARLSALHLRTQRLLI
jgi:hypothetical protein